MKKMEQASIDEDLFLWRLIKRGDRRAFDNFFSKYYTVLCGYCRNYVPPEDAEEIVQDLMVWIWEQKDDFSPRESMKKYLFSSVRNRCITQLRKQDIEVLGGEFFFAELDTFYENIDFCVLNEMEIAVEKAIAGLPENYQETFELMRYQDKNRQEVAAALGISVKTVDYRMQQSLVYLKTQLKEYLPFFIILCRFVQN